MGFDLDIFSKELDKLLKMLKVREGETACKIIDSYIACVHNESLEDRDIEKIIKIIHFSTLEFSTKIYSRKSELEDAVSNSFVAIEKIKSYYAKKYNIKKSEIYFKRENDAFLDILLGINKNVKNYKMIIGNIRPQIFEKKVKELSNVKYVIGNVDFVFGEKKNTLKSLEVIEGNLKIKYAKVRGFDKLKLIDGNLYMTESKVSFPSLEVIEGDIELHSNGDIKKMNKFRDLKGNIIIEGSNKVTINDLPIKNKTIIK